MPSSRGSSQPRDLARLCLLRLLNGPAVSLPLAPPGKPACTLLYIKLTTNENYRIPQGTPLSDLNGKEIQKSEGICIRL